MLPAVLHHFIVMLKQISDWYRFILVVFSCIAVLLHILRLLRLLATTGEAQSVQGHHNYGDRIQ